MQMQFDQNVHGLFMTKAPIMQLQLAECVQVDGGQGLQAILSGLPKLHHPSIHEVHCEIQGRMLQYRHSFPSSAVQMLQQLTHLKLQQIGLQDPGDLRNLQGLTRLQSLHLGNLYNRTVIVTTNMMVQLATAHALQTVDIFNVCPRG